MLKFILLVYAVLHVSFSVPFPKGEAIEEDVINDFIKSLPINQMKSISQKHLENDPGFQAAIKYFKSPEWQTIIDNIHNLPEWVAYKDFLKNSGLDIKPIIDHFTHCLNATDADALKVDDGVKPNLNDFITDMKMNFAVPVMKALHQFSEQVTQDDNMKVILDKVTSSESKVMLQAALNKPEMQIMFQKLKEMGVKVDNIIDIIYSFFELKQQKNTP